MELGISLLFFLFFLIVGLGSTVLWIWMLVDCAMKEPAEGNDKVIWILIILLSHFLGALLYLLVRRPQRIRQFGA